MRQPDRKALEFLALAALKHHEISEGRAVELLGWSRDKIRDQQASQVGWVSPGSLVEALDIMDSNGRHNPDGNSMMLWDKEWERLRQILLQNTEPAGTTMTTQGGKLALANVVHVLDRLSGEAERLQAIVDKLPAWAEDLAQAQNHLHGIRHVGTGKRAVRDVEKAIRAVSSHGVTCRKQEHYMVGGYLHGEDDDSPYLVDGMRYCGRCHDAI